MTHDPSGESGGLTKAFPSDQQKSPSMVRSFSPIHWCSRKRSGNATRAGVRVPPLRGRRWWRVTVDVLLLLGGHHRHQVTSARTAVALSGVPAQTHGEVSVAETLELVPARITQVQVWGGVKKMRRRRGEEDEEGGREGGVETTCLTEIASVTRETDAVDSLSIYTGSSIDTGVEKTV